ncbi:DUF2147 domain-containing protein [Polynucleobacter sp. JS-Safj-400b-B2]|uniref:DUF2147 domain-containing protein n=1 Tax=Polynucleobacter sp. JS-Safj-400b-B2 TaxID=2576921 RepID=UPI001C0C65A6|nr:DUF2147 domain-containing protein [Polynucleobacter sp. JS-Safj-400b-B2]MBU3627185.1 DUF2147 domain-containing protein [Polynucleobacter sp. JS-Safj-400b-B2]
MHSKNKKYFIAYFPAFFCLMIGNIHAQTPDPAVGVWKTISDKTNAPSSFIKIEEVNGALEGTVIKTFPQPNETPLVYCTLCKDTRKDKPIIGMKILSELKRYKPGYWSDGKILDPEEGEIYQVKIGTEDGKKMEVRGYIGVPLLGRTQVWYKVDQ